MDAAKLLALVMTLIALATLVWLELCSRRHSRKEKEGQPDVPPKQSNPAVQPKAGQARKNPVREKSHVPDR